MTTEDLFNAKCCLLDAANMFRERYSQNPLLLFDMIQHCLNTERKLVEHIENVGLGRGMIPPGLSSSANSNAAIFQQLEFIRSQTHDTEGDLRRMEQEQEEFALQYHEYTNLNLTAHLSHIQYQPQNPQNMVTEMDLRTQKEMLEQMLNNKVAHLVQLRLTLADKLKDTLSHLSTLQLKVLDEELILWKRNQQLQGNGAQVQNNLDNIQQWCENLAELIWNNRNQIKKAERLNMKLALGPPGVVDILPTLNNEITELLSSLVTSTFVIEKQPPQVLKKNTRFTSTVRLLVGGRLNVHMTPPQVRVTIINEQEANALLKNNKMAAKGDVSGLLMNNGGTMEYYHATGQLSVTFRNLLLKKINRAEKKGTVSVTDEKFSLLFQSQFSVGGGELVFQVWTLSFPVVVIVHGNQEPYAWATVTWDNAFSEAGRIPFIVPEKVAWHQVADALKMKFKACTGREFTKENMRFLAEKAFRNAQAADYSNMLLTWSQFCKEPLPDRKFTFWEWFYAVMNLTREHLHSPWTDGLIMGFVQRRQAEELLTACASGTFLLRFSDSELGGITIAWVSEQSEVFMLQPFTSKDFAIRSLADRISDLPQLEYLYPHIPKDQAFAKYYTPFSGNQPNPINGYVKPVLVTHVPGISGHSGLLGSYSGTPQNMYQPKSADPIPSVSGVVNDPVRFVTSCTGLLKIDNSSPC